MEAGFTSILVHALFSGVIAEHQSPVRSVPAHYLLTIFNFETLIVFFGASRRFKTGLDFKHS